MADMLSQEEIDALLGGSSSDEDNADSTTTHNLADIEKDALGEIGNISMGTSATTLSSLLNQRVDITTPKVSVVKWSEVAKDYDRPCVAIRVNYVEGIEGANLLVLRQRDTKIISNLMMGGDGTGISEDEELTELDMSAIAESMNMMIGSSCTSLSSIIGERVDIDTPYAYVLDFSNENNLEGKVLSEEYAVRTEFRMQIGDLIDSNIAQLLPMSLAKRMVDVFLPKDSEKENQTPQGPASKSTSEDIMQNQTTYAPQPAAPPQQHPERSQPVQQQAYVTAQPAQFQSFDKTELMQQKENIDIIMDVPLEVTVELGRTTRKIKEILEFTPGSIIELNKLAGEPIDILVNGKFVAKGEVVVIDENFGIRVTSIINSEFRI